MRVPLGEYLPDQPDFENPGLTEAKNVIPAAMSYLPWPSLQAYSSALDARPRGGHQSKDKDGVVYDYTGDINKLYTLSGTGWVDASKGGSPAYALAAEENWEFAKWGEKVIAVSGVNGAATNAPQIITMGGAAFADLSGTPPQARHIGVVRDNVVVGNTYDAVDGNVPNRVRWCGIDDETAWTVSATTQADFQDLQGDGGWVQRIVGGEYGLIFQERSVWRMTYVGSPVVYQFDEVLPGRGTPCPGSVVRVGDNVFFLSQEGFEVIRDGTSSEHIGAEKIDRTFYADFDPTYWYRVTATYDPENHRVYWAYPGAGNSNGRPNKVLCYDWADNRWTHSDQDIEQLFVAATSGVNLDALDAAIIAGRSEIVTNGDFTSGASGWTATDWTVTTNADHNTGNTTDLSQDISAVTGTGYYVTFTISGRTAGTVTPGIGGSSGTARSTDNTYSETIHCGSGSTLLTFTPTSDFDGAVDDISVKSASIDDMTESLDSRAWMGGAAQIGIFDSDNKLAFWSGSALAGVIETGEGEMTPGMHSRISELRPHVDGGTVTVQIGTRNSMADSVSWTGAASRNSRGRVTRRSNARYHRFRLNVSGTFTHASAIDVEKSSGGWR